jgi:pyruvate dehydrogenase E2 component (dihydrolipoamide acetyltransferase)
MQRAGATGGFHAGSVVAEFLMPTLGADMSAGTLVAWKKKEGDRVTRGEIVAEVETDKAAIDVEIFTTGVIEKILIQPGEKVPVGTPLALIREEGQPAPPSAVAPPAPPREKTPPTAPTPVRPAKPPEPSTVEPGRLRISPSAKQLAAELGVDPLSVKGTGPGGAITREDIEIAAQAMGYRRQALGEPPAEPAPSPLPIAPAAERQARMRQAIAAAMARSKREIPHYYLGTTIDMGRAMAWLADENLKRPVADRLLYGVLLIKAVALALREVPELNAVWREGQAVQSPSIHVGVAISLRGGGLVAPALHDTDRQSLSELMRSFRDLVARARAGTLRSSELSDPTITVTSLGEQGVETAFGVIYPPQVALVGFGKVVERPWAVEGQVTVRPVMTATLSADHRVTDGHRGGLFLAAVDRLLQQPEVLAGEGS